MALREIALLSTFLVLALSACTRSASDNVNPIGIPAASLTATVTGPGNSAKETRPPASPKTSTPTMTPKRSTPTPRPSPRASATIALPSGTPAPDWQGIPIMPGALAGRDDGFQYEYSLQQEIVPVLNYYKAQLPKLGWKFDKSGTGYQGEPLLTFKKGAKVLGVSVAILSLDDNLLLVTLAFP